MNRVSGSVGREIAGTLSAYLRGQIKISTILGLLYSVGFAISGVPGWFLIGPVCGALNLVPFLGPLIALALACLVALFGEARLYNFMGVVATFALLQALEGFYLTPKLLGQRVGLKPISVFLAIAVGGFFFGPLGFVLAVPALAIAAVLWRRSRRANAT